MILKPPMPLFVSLFLWVAHSPSASGRGTTYKVELIMLSLVCKSLLLLVYFLFLIFFFKDSGKRTKEWENIPISYWPLAFLKSLFCFVF